FPDVCAVPKPYQKPHPPLRVAAVTEETYAAVGRMGLPVCLAVRTSSISELKRYVGGYHCGWREAGHPGRGEVGVIVPVYVADTERKAREDTEASAMHFYRSVGDALLAGPRRAVGERLRRISFDEVVREYAIYGAPESVTGRATAHNAPRRSHHDALPVESRVPALRHLRRRGIGANPGRPPERRPEHGQRADLRYGLSPEPLQCARPDQQGDGEASGAGMEP